MLPIRLPRQGGAPFRALALALGLVLGGCNSAAPSPSISPSATPSPSAIAPGPTASPNASGPAAAVCPPPDMIPALPTEPTEGYDPIEEQVVALRGLQPRTEVEPQVLDDAGIKKRTTESFRKDNPPELVAANEGLLKGLGLLDRDASLEDIYLEMLGSQVAGLYDPETKELYVVSRSGEIGPEEKTTYAHEYTHALQDQTFDLSSFDLTEVGQGDRSFARLALIEGDATLLMSLWQLEHLTQEELIGLLGESLDPDQLKIFNELPPVLRESLLFPYISGMAFVQCLYADGGWAAVDAAYEAPPASTEQVIHPELYAANEAPITVDLPDDLAARLGEGWKLGLEDTLGEFQLRLWMEWAGGGGGGPVDDAASGWGGDRSAILDGPDGTFAIVLATEWDSPADAQEFVTRAEMALTGVSDPGAVLGPAGGTTATVVIASTDELVGRVQNVLGLAG